MSSPGCGADGYLLVNTSRTLAELGLDDLVDGFAADRLLTVPATEIAREHLGRPLPNAALLGAFAALTGVVSLDAVAAAIAETLPGRGRRAQRRAPPRPPTASSAPRRERWLVRRQIEGSRAVAETVALLPAGGDRRLSDLAADPHRRGARRDW